MQTKEQVYLGVDLGAESGRVIAGLWDGKTMRLEELHRFPNGGVWLGDTFRWDALRLWSEIQNGLAVGARNYARAVRSVGVDTWGVDFTLLSASDELLGQPYHYRDARTRGMLEKAFQRVPRGEIFAATGIQFMEINTLYQLLAVQERSPELLAAAKTFLTMPDFLNFCLSGAKVCEFSIATTTQCYDPQKRGWAVGLLNRFSLPTQIFPQIVQPGTRIGKLRPSLGERTGVGEIDVVTVAAHDTGSAVAAVPAASGRGWAYLSSGTWSLLGVEINDPLVSPNALDFNMTNEGGVDGTFRLLKNITGLWLAQQCKKAFAAAGREHTYPELWRLAGEAPALRSLVDPDDARFVNPPDMPATIQSFCRDTGQAAPETDGALARCTIESLALKYGLVLDGIEKLTGTKIDVIHVVGGGSQNVLLNQFTADATGRTVLAGPVEATVLGNLLVQARAFGEIKSLADIRAVVRNSSNVREFQPEPASRSLWKEARGRFASLLNRAR
jgi:rhamnulokinase